MNARQLMKGMFLGLAAGVATAYLTDPEPGKKARRPGPRSQEFFDQAAGEIRKPFANGSARATTEEAELLKTAGT